MSLPDERGTRRRTDWAALVIAAGLAALAVVIFWDAQRLGGAATYARIGPKTVPVIVSICLAGLAVWTTIEAWRGDFPERERQNLPPLIWIVGGLAVQMLLLTTAGFSIATGLLFAATAKAFGKGPLWKTIPIGIVLAFIVWFAFAKGLQLSLPQGPVERLF
jgi:putative tricarboxylic transport membrane protein